MSESRDCRYCGQEVTNNQNRTFSKSAGKWQHLVCENKAKALISCPFCNESDFDQPGLKNHLVQGDCEPFNVIPGIPRVFA